MNLSTAERDKSRFVAFAFAAAETFLEINADGKICFQTGVDFPARLVAGGKCKPSITSFKDIIHPDDIALFEVTMRKLAKNGRVGPVNIQIGGHNGNWGRTRFYGIHLPENKDYFYLSLRAAGVTLALPKSDDKRDKETGLLNTEAFTDIASQAMQSTDETQITMTRFAGLSKHAETATEEEHNSLLKNIAAHLQALSIEGQVAARVGDEEFAILNDNHTSAEEIATTVNAIPGGDMLTATTKTIDAKADKLDEADIISAVTYTLEQFKKSKGEIEIENFNEAYELAFEDTQNRIQDIRTAIEKNTFRLAFQPIVEMDNGKLHHYELLARPPENFKDTNIFEIVQFIEATGLSEQFDFTMFTLALDFIQKSHRRKEFISLAVNISGNSIQSEEFAQKMLNKLQGLPRINKWLVIEITESSKIVDLQGAAKSIKALRDKGFVVCLDDFGAGASGYQYLHQLKVDYVKIDGIYVREMMESKESTAFIKSMVSLCKDLDIKTIAEYVEKPEQFAALNVIGVDYAQGWLYGAAESLPSYKPKQERVNQFA